jgi:hypothetical protein
MINYVNFGRKVIQSFPLVSSVVVTSFPLVSSVFVSSSLVSSVVI